MNSILVCICFSLLGIAPIDKCNKGESSGGHVASIAGDENVQNLAEGLELVSQVIFVRLSRI